MLLVEVEAEVSVELMEVEAEVSVELSFGGFFLLL